MADFYDAEIGGAGCEVLEHALDQVRADSDALKCRIDDQKIQQPRLNAKDEADDSATAMATCAYEAVPILSRSGSG